jgi:hypothetical protein
VIQMTWFDRLTGTRDAMPVILPCQDDVEERMGSPCESHEDVPATSSEPSACARKKSPESRTMIEVSEKPRAISELVKLMVALGSAEGQSLVNATTSTSR